jgi:hypothetical protein
VRADTADAQVMVRCAAVHAQIAGIAPADDDRAVAEREDPFLAVGSPPHVGPAFFDDRRAQPVELLGSHHQRTAGLCVPVCSGVRLRRRLCRHVVEEEGELADRDLVTTLDRRQAREP